jgi:hypothetical protein
VAERSWRFDSSLAHKKAAVGNLVKPLGSDPRDFESSILSRSTKPKYANLVEHSDLKSEGCWFESSLGHFAAMLELVDILDSKSGAFGCAGSSPARGT